MSARSTRLARVGFALTGAFASLCLVLLTPAAHAVTGDELLVSNDGEEYTASPTFGLFDDSGTLVPGDTIEDSVWVLNSADQRGRVRFDLTHVTSTDSAWARSLVLDVAVPGGGTYQLPIADALAKNACIVLDDTALLEAGEQLKITARLSVDPALDERDGVLGEVDLTFRVGIAEPDAPARAAGTGCVAVPDTAPPSPEPTPPWPLPATGGEIPIGVVIAAVGILAIGGGLYIVARKRRGDD